MLPATAEAIRTSTAVDHWCTCSRTVSSCKKIEVHLPRVKADLFRLASLRMRGFRSLLSRIRCTGTLVAGSGQEVLVNCLMTAVPEKINTSTYRTRDHCIWWQRICSVHLCKAAISLAWMSWHHYWTVSRRFTALFHAISRCFTALLCDVSRCFTALFHAVSKCVYVLFRGISLLCFMLFQGVSLLCFVLFHGVSLLCFMPFQGVVSLLCFMVFQGVSLLCFMLFQGICMSCFVVFHCSFSCCFVVFQGVSLPCCIVFHYHETAGAETVL